MHSVLHTETYTSDITMCSVPSLLLSSCPSMLTSQILIYPLRLLISTTLSQNTSLLVSSPVDKYLGHFPFMYYK